MGSLPQVLRSIGHCCFEAAVLNHFSRQCKWNTCVHSPQTKIIGSAYHVPDTAKELLSGQSSPGILHDGQHPSKGTRQIPQTSLSPSVSSDPVFPVSQRHCATACQCLTVTFIIECIIEDVHVTSFYHHSNLSLPSLPAGRNEWLRAVTSRE